MMRNRPYEWEMFPIIATPSTRVERSNAEDLLVRFDIAGQPGIMASGRFSRSD